MKTLIQIPTTQEYKEQLMKEAKEKNMTLASYIKAILNERKK